MLDLLHLKTFIAVATTKNFNRAAAQLGYSQSTVTHHIKLLEQELGARLFDRFKFARAIALTDVGSRVHGYAARLLALVEEIRSAARPVVESGEYLSVGVAHSEDGKNSEGSK